LQKSKLVKDTNKWDCARKKTLRRYWKGIHKGAFHYSTRSRRQVGRPHNKSSTISETL